MKSTMIEAVIGKLQVAQRKAAEARDDAQAAANRAHTAQVAAEVALAEINAALATLGHAHKVAKAREMGAGPGAVPFTVGTRVAVLEGEWDGALGEVIAAPDDDELTVKLDKGTRVRLPRYAVGHAG